MQEPPPPAPRVRHQPLRLVLWLLFLWCALVLLVGVQRQFDALLALVAAALAAPFLLLPIGVLGGVLLLILAEAAFLMWRRVGRNAQPITKPPHVPSPTATPTRAPSVLPPSAPGAAPGMTRRVFLSSTSLDLREHRARVHDDLERLNQFAVDMAQVGAGGADATTVSLTELGTAEFVVLIVAWRYGHIPRGQTRSITQMEYEEALRLGLPVYVYLADPRTEGDKGPKALFPASV